MKIYVFYILLSISGLVFDQQIEKAPPEINAFIPKGFEVLSLTKGDINNDKLVDFILVCKNKKEAEDGGLPRLIMLILQDANKKFKVARKTEKAIMCAGCGGVMGDPFSGVEVNKNGNFTIQHYGGSSWRWTKDATFRFDGKNNWVLTYEKNITFHSSEPEKTLREYAIPENEFLVPKTIESYTGEDEGQGSNWKVIAEKTFFHNQADEKTARKGFLLKGNKVETYVETKNFIWVEYPKNDDQFKRGTLGFILKRDLEKLK